MKNCYFIKPVSEYCCSIGPPDSEHEGVTIKITAHSDTQLRPPSILAAYFL